ncbi:unnamed protein product [Adineta steineri]|uniref:Uncharacterized protein n=1 Tax=Adineta steineri TaxID=433720 RepID=A0A814FU53_9BILA|nr:unnamed protein product [Adineta steineri]CAF0994790.1 unnamed protein product [Adineta steineri]
MKIPSKEDLRRLFNFLKSHLYRLNLFNTASEDEPIIENERRSTRLYLVLLVTSMMIFLAYYSAVFFTEDIFISSPSLIEYDRIQKEASLQCPCTNIAVKYEVFTEVVPTYHQLCESALVSDEWINRLFRLYEQSWNNSTPIDFRRIGVFQFQTLRSLCELANDTISRSLQSFNYNNFVQSLLVSPDIFEGQIGSFIKEFIEETPKTFLRAFNFMQDTTAQSLFMAGASITSVRPVTQYTIKEFVRGIVPYPGVNYTFTDNSTCVCSSSTATTCMGLATFDNNVLPGFQTGCYMLNALMNSTLEAFDNQTLINRLNNSSRSFQKLNSSNSHWKIEKLLSQIIPRSTNETILRQQRHTTRLYLVLLLVTSITLICYVFLEFITISKTIESPSLKTFTQLSKEYPLTLDCPCSRTSFEYKQFFSDIKVEYHEICSSEFITARWIQLQFVEFPTRVFWINDFRFQSQMHFQLLSTLCRVAKQTIEDNLQSFYRTKFITPKVIDNFSFQIESELILEQFKRTVPESYRRTLQLIEANPEINQLIVPLSSIFRSDRDVHNKTVFRLKSEATALNDRPVCMAGGEGKNEDNCECSFLLLNYSNECVLKTFVWNEHVDRDTIPGMRLTVSPVRSVLISTLECFYDATCLFGITRKINSLVSPTNFSTLRLSSLTMNESQYDTIDMLAKKLFIRTWSNNQSSYESYFNQCHPLSCQYSYLAAMVEWLRCSARIHKSIVEFSIFPAIPSSQTLNNLRRNRRLTRIYFTLLLISLLILVVYTSLTKETTSGTIESPSISKYLELYNQYPLTFQCSYSNLAVKYEKFIRQIEPQRHPICSSDFFSSDRYDTVWIWLQRDFVTARVIIPDEFDVQINGFIEEFKRTISNELVLLFKLMQVTNLANQLATTQSSNWEFIVNQIYNVSAGMIVIKLVDRRRKRRVAPYPNIAETNSDDVTLNTIPNVPITAIEINVDPIQEQIEPSNNRTDRIIGICLCLLVIVAIVVASVISTGKKDTKYIPITTSITTLITTTEITKSTTTSAENIYMTLMYQSETYPIGRDAKSFILRDLNGDSFLDLAVTNYGDDTFSILFGNGNGTFRPQQVYSTGDESYPWGIASGDLNNDTFLDIAVTLTKTNQIVIFFGTALNGSFNRVPHTMLIPCSTVYQPRLLEVRDLNGDGCLDLLFDCYDPHFGGDYFVAALNRGNGSDYQSQSLNLVNTWDIESVVFGDFDHDGKKNDIGFCSGENKVFIFSAINYAEDDKFKSKDFSANIHGIPQSVIRGRFNDDDFDDIALVAPQSNGLHVLLATGDGKFLQQIYHINNCPISVVRINFNNDSIDDLAILHSNQTIGIYLGTKLGIFSEEKISCQVGENCTDQSFRSLKVADLNQDGKDDLVVIDPINRTIQVLLSANCNKHF